MKKPRKNDRPQQTTQPLDGALTSVRGGIDTSPIPDRCKQKS